VQKGVQIGTWSLQEGEALRTRETNSRIVLRHTPVLIEIAMKIIRSAAVLIALVAATVPLALAPASAQSETDVHVYALGAGTSCGTTTRCPVELVALAPGVGGSDSVLGRIQTSTGASPAISSIALSPDNHVYGVGGRHLYSIDTACTASVCLAKSLGTASALGTDTIAGMTFNPDGRLFAGTAGGKLVTLSTQNGQSTLVHDFGGQQPDVPAPYSGGLVFHGGLAFGLKGILYATVVPCAACAPASESPQHDGLIAIAQPTFTDLTVVSRDIGFPAVDGLVFVAGADAGSPPVLLGTTLGPAADAGCATGSALVRLSADGTGTLARCASLPLEGATANPILPPLIISVKLHSSVQARATQVVQAEVSPVTLTRMTVSFPNGDTFTRKQISDTLGTVIFKFTQSASKVARRSNTARVRIDVGSGGTLTSDVYAYHIGFASVDAVVSPRSAAPGDGFTIYVHTWPRRSLLVYLLYPNSHVFELVGRTGASGWASFHRTVDRGALYGSADSIQIVAVLNPGPLKDSATTSLGVSAPGQR
jgi:hypothetical protein